MNATGIPTVKEVQDKVSTFIEKSGRVGVTRKQIFAQFGLRTKREKDSEENRQLVWRISAAISTLRANKWIEEIGDYMDDEIRYVAKGS